MYNLIKVFDVKDLPLEIYALFMDYIYNKSLSDIYIEYIPFFRFVKDAKEVNNEKLVIWKGYESVYEKGDDLIGDWLVNNGASPFETILIKL